MINSSIVVVNAKINKTKQTPKSILKENTYVDTYRRLSWPKLKLQCFNNEKKSNDQIQMEKNGWPIIFFWFLFVCFNGNRQKQTPADKLHRIFDM